MVIILIIGITVVSSNITAKFVKSEVERNLDKNIQFLSEKISLVYKETATFTKMAISDTEIQEFSNIEKSGGFVESENLKRILASFVKPRTYIEDINLYYFNSYSYYGSSFNFEASPRFLNDTEGLNKVLSPMENESFGIPFYSINSSQFLLPYYRKIYDGKSGKTLGLIESLVPVTMFTSTIDNSIFLEEGNLYIIDEDGKIIIHANQNLILDKIPQKKLQFLKNHLNTNGLYQDSVFCQTKIVPRTGWIIVNEIPKNVVEKESQKMKKNFLLIGGFALLATVGLAFSLSSSITKPLLEMEKSISAMDNLDSIKYVPVHSLDEIGKLGKQYNKMIDRVAQAAEKERKRDVLMKQYELALLQAQINPHFLNNILENVCGLIELDRKKDSISLIRDTADFYRSILSTDNLIISLKQEITIIELYLKIQNVRWNNRISYTINIPEEYLTQAIVKLTLQPLVENSIGHGMDYTITNLHIDISCYSDGKNLIILIKDDGIGISKQKLEKILIQEPTTVDGKIKHIGVYATDQRLKLHFGNEYGLKYKQRTKKGTIVEITLPREEISDEIW